MKNGAIIFILFLIAICSLFIWHIIIRNPDNKAVSVKISEMTDIAFDEKEMELLQKEGEKKEQEAIKVKDVYEAVTKLGEKIYMVDFGYQFKDVSTVYIEELGSVPRQGELKYLTYEPQIEFRESSLGNTLASYSLEPMMAVVASPIVIDIPQEAEFPEESLYGSWESVSSVFPSVALEILNDKFESGIIPYNRFQIHYFRTSYADLYDLPAKLYGKIAVLLSYPYQEKDGGSLFRIQSKALEKRRKSGEWREILSNETIKSKNIFLKGLKVELEKKGRKQ